MKRISPLSLFLLAFVALVVSPAYSQSAPVRDGNVEAQLITGQDAIVPGESFILGLKFAIDPHWHTYWINPGETGKATQLALTLPEGFKAGPLQYPVPKRFVTDFGYNIIEAGFGYEKEVVHTVTVTAPADLKVGETVTLTGEAGWLMCDSKSCNPGKAALSIELPVKASSEVSADAGLLKTYAKKLPSSQDWATDFVLADGKATVSVAVPDGTLPDDAKLHLFPYKKHIFNQLSEPEIARDAGKVSFVFEAYEKLSEAPESFGALLIAETPSGKTGYRVTKGDPVIPTVVSEMEAPSGQLASSGAAGNVAESVPFGGGVIGSIIAAFLGGIILNIMPCVFPVISLKVMSFVGQAGEDRRKVFAHSLTFALGILIFFWLLAAMMIILKSVGGGDVGWAVQFRQPAYVIGLIMIMVIVSLSLFGVFEIGASMTTVGGELANKSGYAGSFWSGALTVLLATPCTAPLMAPAITYALTQSGPVLFLIFTALGLGLAAPYFVFAVFPKLLALLPPPGGWMDTFKQLMGFPMLAFAIWLIGVLSKQLSVSGLQWALGAVLLVAFAAWVLGRYTGFDKAAKTRTVGRVVALAVFLAAVGVAWEASAKRPESNSIDYHKIIADYRDQGKPVFVDFTAEWCLTCKANEAITIKTDEVQQMFRDNNIQFVVADWTNENPTITEILKANGRSGVPFYLLYPADSSLPPIAFGDGVISKDAIAEAIEKL